MMTVVDQQSPWLMPSSTFAKTTHAQLGAQMSSNGTGTPASQPATRMRLRPTRSASPPAARLAAAFTAPKPTRNESVAALDARPNSACASSGSTARSSPTIAPTNALTTTRRANWRQLARRPRRITSRPGAALPLRVSQPGPPRARPPPRGGATRAAPRGPTVAAGRPGTCRSPASRTG